MSLLIRPFLRLVAASKFLPSHAGHFSDAVTKEPDYILQPSTFCPVYNTFLLLDHICTYLHFVAEM